MTSIQRKRAVQHEQYLLWYDSTPAGRARQHGRLQRKKTKLDGAQVVHHSTQNMVGNDTILPQYPTSASIDNSSSHQQPRPSVAPEKPPQNNTNISSQQQQGRISKLQSKASAPADTRESTVTPITVHATCRKDRHSKVRTAKGLRDTRVRLSAPTAVRFFDVQDRLGYDQPSKAMDWLIKEAHAAIVDLAPVKSIVLAGDKGSRALGTATEEIDRCQDADEQCEKEEQQSPTSGAQAISRVRARDSVKEKSSKMSALPLWPTSPAISMSPEILLLSQFQHPSPLQPSDFPSDAILPQSATSYGPPPTHFFHIAPECNAPFVFDDFPTVLPSAYSSYHTNNNTLISPRGTLQSIFIDSITSPVPAMQSYDMMGPGGNTYEAAVTDNNQSTDVPASSADLCIPLSIHNQQYPKMLSNKNPSGSLPHMMDVVSMHAAKWA